MAINIYNAIARSNELRSAADKLNSAIKCIDDSISNLNKGASAQRIKTAISKLESLKIEISSKQGTLYDLADRITNIAYQIQQEENNENE